MFDIKYSLARSLSVFDIEFKRLTAYTEPHWKRRVWSIEESLDREGFWSHILAIGLDH